MKKIFMTMLAAVAVTASFAQGNPKIAKEIKATKDFVAVGDVDIRVIGADNQILDSEVPEFYCGTSSTFSTDSYYAHMVYNAEDGQYVFTLNETGENVTEPSSFEIDATHLSESSIDISAPFSAQILSNVPTTVNEKLFNGSSSLVIAADASATTLTEGTVTVTNTNDLPTTSNGTVSVALAEESTANGEVVVTVSAGTVTSITGTDDGEIVSYGGSEYQRVDAQIIVTTEGATSAIYDEIDDSNDLCSLGDT